MNASRKMRSASLRSATLNHDRVRLRPRYPNPQTISMNVNETLRQFDGKHVEPLEVLATKLLTREGCVDELLVLSNSDDIKTQSAATWVLKRLHEQQFPLSKSQTREVLRLLRCVTHWEAKLHLLQMLGGLEIPSRLGGSLRKTLDEHMADDNKLVRAWAYNGLFVLGEQFERFRAEVVELLDKAQHDPAASVRVRVRRVRKASCWAATCRTNR